MLLNILLGCLMVFVTTGVHASGMVLLLRIFLSRERLHRSHSEWSRMCRVGEVVLLLFLVSIVEVTIWGGLYLLLGVLEGYEQAVYFSTVTFTTLGYGDIVIHEKWRLLAAFEAAAGIIMFGWSTAIVLSAVQRVYAPVKPQGKRELEQS